MDGRAVLLDALVVAILHRIVYAILALFRSVTERSDEHRHAMVGL
jgi:hypothetical protein